MKKADKLWMRLRPVQKFLMNTDKDGRVTAGPSFGIECKTPEDKKWILLGDEKGFFKFATAEERDAKLKELRDIIKTDSEQNNGK